MLLSYKYLTLHIPLSLLRWLKGHMRYLRAAGGIITAPDGTMLLIRRNNRWDLPKGKVEPGETLFQAALREVEEETGIHVDTILPGSAGDTACDQRGANLSTCQHVIKTYHIFKWGTQARRANFPKGWHLKQTSWFELQAHKQPARPQQEEGITEVVWVTPDEWHRRLHSSYGTLRTLSSLTP